MTLSRTKGTDVVALRKMFKEKGEAAEKEFLSRLSPAVRDLYQQSLAFQWNAVELQTQLYRAAAEALFPGSPDPLRRLGYEMARRSYSGVYQFLLRIPSTSFVIHQAAKLWNTYFEQGKASVEVSGAKSAVFWLREYPELPADMRQVVRGNITAAAETTGAKHVRVEHVDADPEAWGWSITWE